MLALLASPSACFRSQPMNRPLIAGVAHLHGYKVDPSISIGKKHAFALVPPDDSLRTFQFSAENETDRIR